MAIDDGYGTQRPAGSARVTEGDLDELRRQIINAQQRSERLADTLRVAREQIINLKAEVDRLAEPPSGYAVFLGAHDDETADIFSGGRKIRVTVSPAVGVQSLEAGQEVMLNEAMNIVKACGFERQGEIVTLKEILEDRERALVVGRTDEERVVLLAASLLNEPIRAGDSLLMESRSGYVYERIPKAEAEELVLEEVPDIDYEDIGGLGPQIEAIRDAVELPYLHADLFAEHQLRAPKGILLYGPPGCGKTLIASRAPNYLINMSGRPSDIYVLFFSARGRRLARGCPSSSSSTRWTRSSGPGVPVSPAMSRTPLCRSYSARSTELRVSSM